MRIPEGMVRRRWLSLVALASAGEDITVDFEGAPLGRITAVSPPNPDGSASRVSFIRAALEARLG